MQKYQLSQAELGRIGRNGSPPLVEQIGGSLRKQPPPFSSFSLKQASPAAVWVCVAVCLFVCLFGKFIRERAPKPTSNKDTPASPSVLVLH